MDTVEHDPYAPRRFEDLAGASDWGRLQALISRADPPSLVVAGPAGIGKSCALRLALSGRITLWLRCSQDPTLRDSRDRIKAAAPRRVMEGRVNWIVLEHADMLHTDAQTFLRRIIETTVGSSRFILEVRDASAIAEPLLSRCVLFHAPQMLKHEIQAEVLRRAPTCDPATAAEIATQSNGNIRWAILQAIGSGAGCLAPELPTPASVTDWHGVLHAMEELQKTGSVPRTWLQSVDPVWERPGGADPWALTALALASRL